MTRAALAFAGLAGLAVLSGRAEAALKTPLAKTGPCPELTRAPMPSPPRFQNNPNDITIKKFPNTMQVDLPPEQSVNCTQTPVDFKVETWASEKDIGNIKAVQNFTFDERGRVWAVETFDYPNTVKDPFAGGDRVIILEDTDGDRVMDKQTVFVSGLNIPQGIEIVPGGIVVAMAPHLVLFTDKNGDDKADSPTGTILYTGFKKNDPGDTHGGIGHIKYAPDGWLYGSVGYNGGVVKGIGFSQGTWRAKLDGTKFEFLGKLTNNAAGIGISEEGEVFASTANNDHTFHLSVPSASDPMQGISAYGQSYKPVTKDVCQGDWFGNFTAASNHEIYTARLFPQAYWNRAAFVCEGTGHLVNVDFLKRKGSTWEATRIDAAPNLFASTDAWTAPVASKVGPDGAVWVLDWYNYLFLHNGESPEGVGHAYISDLRTKKACRIYRVAPASGKLDPIPNLTGASNEVLVSTFRHTNMLWRLNAQKILLRNTVTTEAKAALEPLLIAAVKNRQKDEVDNDPLFVHALWTAQNLGLFEASPAKWDPLLKDALLHPAAGARMNVLRAMPLTAASAQAIKDQGRVNDTDPHVRIQALMALANNTNKAAGVSMFVDFRNLDDASKLAFLKSGVAELATKPAIPELQPVAIGDGKRGARGVLAPNRGLRFGMGANGIWEPLADGRLEPGDLSLFDLAGKVTRKLRYDGSAWKVIYSAGGNAGLYAFRGRSGSAITGSLPVAGIRP
ncbi:MAG: putative rane-bound dehydrogenase [Fibrobacteres bacterium]|nr:putative rane-bound dehydrogenase [Fibrobacterota bacterium]